MKRWILYTLAYLRRPPWDTDITPPELVAFVQSTPPGQALDLGCGTGTNSLYLARHGWQVVGVDFVPRAIRKAQHKARQAGLTVDFRVGDVTRLDNLPGPFNLIVDIGCLHSLPIAGQAAYRANLQRWLPPNGTFLLYAFTPPEETARRGIAGLLPAQVAALEADLHLAQRRNGTERGRASAWFIFRPRMAQ